MLLNIDWLQLNCRGVISKTTGYQIKQMEYSTRQFKIIQEIYINNKLFCTCVSCPFSSVLASDMVLLKVANEHLYSPTLFSDLDKLIRDFYLRVKGLSRLDLCCDFTEFYNHRSVSKFLNQFMKNEVKKMGKATYKIQGMQKRRHVIDYLRFGTNNSDVSVYLYNKTKELNEVKMKPYICDCWRASGLDVEKTVWRLEFSIKSSRIKLVDEDTGVIHSIDYHSIKEAHFKELIFSALLKSYFSFRTNSGCRNVSREKNIKLFEDKYLTTRRYRFSGLGDATRADKIFVKKMEETNCQLRNIKKSYNNENENMLFDFIIEKGLENYYLDRIKGELTERIIKYKELRAKQLEDDLNSIQYSEQLKLAF